MSYKTNSILTDKDGRPIPQYFDEVLDKFMPALGKDGSAGMAVNLGVANIELTSGLIGIQQYLEIPVLPPGSTGGLLISLEQEEEEEDENLSLYYEFKINETTWLPWKDGEGNLVITPIDGNGVYGPIRGFPMFKKGRISIIDEEEKKENIAINKVYACSTGYGPENAFDENRDTRWSSGTYYVENQWVAIDVGAPILTNAFMIWGRDGSSTPREFRFEATNVAIDALDENWVPLVSGTIERNGEEQYWNYLTETTYRYYRLFVLNNYYQDADISVYDVRIYKSKNSIYNATVRGISL